jgi:hypothetical protein
MRRRKPESAIRKGTREVFEIVKSDWPVTPAELMELKHYEGKEKTGHTRLLNNLRTLQKAGLIELKQSGHVYVAWPKDVEKLRDEQLAKRLLKLHEALLQIVDHGLKERTKGRARQ